MLADDGLDEILRDLDGIGDALDPSVNADLVGDLVGLVRSVNAGTLRQEQSPDGRRFRPLSPRYAAWKRAAAPGRPIGELTGVMKAAIGDEAGYQVHATGGTLAIAPPAAAMARIADFDRGGARTGTRQPPRPIWGLDERSGDIAVQMLDGSLVRRLTGRA